MFTRAGWKRTTLPFAVALAAVVAIVGIVGGTAATLIGMVAVAAGVVWVSAAVHRWDMGAARLLGGAVERMTAGDFDARVRLRGEDKLGEVGFRLNLLAETLNERIEALGRQCSDLSGLVDALPDAVMLADPQQRVVRINEPAAKFLGIDAKQAAGQMLIAVLGEAGVIDAYEHAVAKADSEPVMRELRVTRSGQRMTYEVVAARTAAGGVLVVLSDITAMTEAARMKTDFVANASHELRTPIAAIKIAFETMSDILRDDPEQAERCQTIIAGHLKRLEEMLQDLLDLSRVEAAEAEPDYVEIDAANLLATVHTAMASLAAGKGVALDVGGSGAFVSDKKLLDVVLKNLVENAVKYTPAGGRVTATVVADGSGATIVVTDTGVGIPPQHTERVFERFYQVDPARSGSAGRGTGLGLAIVKHAVAVLGGRVTLTSVVGRGTTVTCTVPNAVTHAIATNSDKAGI